MSGTKNGTMKPRWSLGVVALALVGVAGYDGVQSALAKSAVTDDATQIAHDSATIYHNTNNINTAYAAAQAEAQSKGTTIPSTDDFSVTSTGTVSLTLAKSNNTLVLGRLDSSLKTFTAKSSSTWAP